MANFIFLLIVLQYNQVVRVAGEKGKLHQYHENLPDR
jgi:hypothetical protein